MFWKEILCDLCVDLKINDEKENFDWPQDDQTVFASPCLWVMGNIYGNIGANYGNIGKLLWKYRGKYGNI